MKHSLDKLALRWAYKLISFVRFTYRDINEDAWLEAAQRHIDEVYTKRYTPVPRSFVAGQT